MASNSTISITFKLDGDNKGLKSLIRDTDGLRKAMSSAITEASRLDTKLVNFAAISTVVSGTQSAITSLTSALRGYTDAYAVQSQAEAQLEEVMRQRMNASAAEVQSIKDLASAQQQLGVIGDEVQLSGAQQVATFLTQKSSIETLLPAMNDLLAQQKGLNATSGDAVSIANLVGKAMQGQTSALTRVGITFNAAQEQIMKYGDEQTRAATLAQIITDNVGHMNAKLAQTDSGKLQQVKNTLGDIGEEVGRLANSAMPFLSMAAAATTALGGVIKLVTGIKAGIAVVASWNIKSKAMIVMCRLMGVEATRSAAVVRVFSSALRGGAYSATAFKLAIRGLLISTVVGAAIVALTMIVEHLVTALDKASDSTDELIDAEKRAKREAEEMAEAQHAEETTLKSNRAALQMNISRLKEFNGTKADEKKIVREMNETYGETMGYFSSVSEWYEALIANSEAYCRQMVLEARTRMLANQIAQKEQENYAITHNEDGTQRTYSTRRKTELVGGRANTYSAPGMAVETAQRREIVGSSAQEKAQAAYDANTASIKALTEELDKAVKQSGAITYKVKGSAKPTDTETTSTNDKLTDRQRADLVDIGEVMSRNLATLADYDKALEELRLKQKYASSQEYASLQRNIDAVEAQKNAFTRLGQTMAESTRADAIDVTEVMGRNRSSIADCDKALEDLRLKQKYVGGEYADIQRNIEAVEEQKNAFKGLKGTITELEKAQLVDVTAVMGRNKDSLADYDRALEDLRLKQKYVGGEYASLQRNITMVENERDAFNRLGQTMAQSTRADAIDVTEVLSRNKDSVADYDKALEELRLKQKYASSEEYAALQQNITLIENERDAFTRLGQTMAESTRADAIDVTEVLSRNIASVADYDRAIQDLRTKQRTANQDEYGELQRSISALEMRREAFTKLRTPINDNAATLREITANIATLNDDLETATATEAALINRQIEAWNRKADAIRNAGQASQATFDTFKSGWGAVKGLNGALESVGDTLRGNNTVWQKSMALVDAFITVCESIRSLVGIFNMLSTVSKAHAAATAAETAATVTNTAAVATAAAEAPVAAAADIPLITANKALAASYLEAATAAYFAAHAYIPFAGFGIGSGFATSAAAMVKSMGLMAFANGGIAYGPTLGLFGEYAGASHNPEVVAPLDKLKDLIGGTAPSEIKVTGKLVGSGRTLYAIIENEASHIRRNG